MKYLSVEQQEATWDQWLQTAELRLWEATINESINPRDAQMKKARAELERAFTLLQQEHAKWLSQSQA